MSEKYKIVVDTDPSNPLDDEYLVTDGHVRIASLRPGYGTETIERGSGRQEFLDSLDEDDVAFPLYMYEHGGVSVSMSPYSCPWDSGQVGWVVAKASIRKELSPDGVLFPDDIRNALEGIVSQYDDYLRGDVYGLVVEGDESSPDVYGFFGSDPFKNGMSEHVPPEDHALLHEAANAAGLPSSWKPATKRPSP